MANPRMTGALFLLFTWHPQCQDNTCHILDARNTNPTLAHIPSGDIQLILQVGAPKVDLWNLEERESLSLDPQVIGIM